MHNKKLYIDVTQLVHSDGRLTGIPRVMHELSIRFGKNWSGTTFVSWVKEIQEFCEVDLEKSMANISKGVVYSKAGQVATATPDQVRNDAEAKVTFLKKQGVRFVKAGLKRAARFSPQLAKKLEDDLILMRIKTYKVAQFQPGDKLFITWGEWWDPRFTDKLVDLQQKGVGLIQLIHDIATTVWPQFFEQVSVSPSDYNTKILPIADMVLAVSENTKKELIEWLQSKKLRVPPINVFRNGEDLRAVKPVKPSEEAFTRSGLKGNDFLLSVGTIEAKKNHFLYYYVYKLAKARGIDLPKLVITGRRGYGTDCMYNIMTRDPEVRDQFVFLYASDAEMSWLYDHCLFTMVASFHEGWGIPIAESLARGTPCLCSNTSSMIEIAEGYVEHFSPASSDELLNGIQHWLDPKKLAAARKRATQYKQWTWDASYKQVAAYMEGLYGQERKTD